jgi:hypothetical protein
MTLVNCPCILFICSATFALSRATCLPAGRKTSTPGAICSLDPEKYARCERGKRSAPPWPYPVFVFRAAKQNPPA